MSRTPAEVSAAIDAIFTEWFPQLVRYAYRSTGDFALAEDVAQSAFLALYRAWMRGDPIEHPKAWLLCVVRREVIRHAERDWEGDPLDEDGQPGGAAAGEPPEALAFDELLRHFGVLTRREEEVLLLRLQSMKYREIASQLGLSVPSVGTLLARAVRKLKKALTARTGGIAAGRFEEKEGYAPRRVQ